jgi:hypothetical protein
MLYRHGQGQGQNTTSQAWHFGSSILTILGSVYTNAPKCEGPVEGLLVCSRLKDDAHHLLWHKRRCGCTHDVPLGEGEAVGTPRCLRRHLGLLVILLLPSVLSHAWIPFASSAECAESAVWRTGGDKTSGGRSMVRCAAADAAPRAPSRASKRIGNLLTNCLFYPRNVAFACMIGTEWSGCRQQRLPAECSLQPNVHSETLLRAYVHASYGSLRLFPESGVLALLPSQVPAGQPPLRLGAWLGILGLRWLLRNTTLQRPPSGSGS